MLDKKIHKIKSNMGFSLIEVLIAMFVLSVGMLGSTGMMLQGRASATNTNNEAKASQLALVMAEQMRANIAGVNAQNYDAIDTASAADPTCINTACSVADMADYDAFIWKEALSKNLPSGSGTVTVTTAGANDDSIFTIAVNWTKTRKTGADTGVVDNKAYTMMFQP